MLTPQKTLALVREYKFPAVHISQFYPRPGTPAARMPRVLSKAVKERSRALTALHESYRPLDALVGQTVRAWFVDVAADGRKLVGHTKNYSQVLVEPMEGLLGSSAMVRVVSATRWSVLGEVVSVVTTAHADAVAAGTAPEVAVGMVGRGATKQGAGKTRGAALAAAASEAGGGCGDGGCGDGGGCGSGDCESGAGGGVGGGCGPGCDCEGEATGGLSRAQGPVACADAGRPGAAAEEPAAASSPASASGRHVSFDVAAERGRSQSRKPGVSTNSATARAARDSPDGGGRSESASRGGGDEAQSGKRRQQQRRQAHEPGGAAASEASTALFAGDESPSAKHGPAAPPAAVGLPFGQVLLFSAAALLLIALLSLLLASNVQLLRELLEEQLLLGMGGAPAAGSTSARGSVAGT